MCIMATVRGGSSIIELQELLRCQHLSQLSNLSNFTTQLSSNQIKTGSCLLTHSLTQSRFSIGVKEHVWAKLTDFIQVSHKQCVIHGFHFVSQRIAENKPHISGGGESRPGCHTKLFTAQDTIQAKPNLISLGDLRMRVAISSPV